MILAYILALMILCYVLAYIEELLPRHYYNYIVWGVIFLMVIISGTRPGTHVSDFVVYEGIFYNYDSTVNQLSIEATFLWICELFNKLGGTIRWVIWLYALISIPLKIYSISRLATPVVFLLAIPIHLGNFFQLHDCEQMRVAAALSLGWYCFLLKTQGKKWTWIPFWLVAISFHHTAAALIVPLLITPDRALSVKWRVGMVLVILAGIFFWITKINPITTLPIPYIEAKMALYELAISRGEHPDMLVLHPIVLLRIITFLYVLFFYDVIYERLKCLNIILICEMLGLFCWFGLSMTSVFAVRMSELFEETDCILFASVVYTVTPSWAGKIYPILFSLYIFLYGCKVNQFGFL
ncbi:MAG: EpsG family protein [Prevotella sp.]|nr:EpsG family protein [Prevotella sp.]